jgi:hypothetical protein
MFLRKKKKVIKGPLPASLVPLDMDEFSDSVVSGRFRLFPELLCVTTEVDPEELKQTKAITFLKKAMWIHSKTLS